MVGLGETDEEVLDVLLALRAHGVDMLTIGQYLQPTGGHMPVLRYVHPDIFKIDANAAYQMGFKHAASGSLVRSSYRADEQARAAGVLRLQRVIRPSPLFSLLLLFRTPPPCNSPPLK